MDWLSGLFLMFPFCLVSTCGIPLLILIVVLIVRASGGKSEESTGSVWDGMTRYEQLEAKAAMDKDMWERLHEKEQRRKEK